MANRMLSVGFGPSGIGATPLDRLCPREGLASED